MSEKRRDSTYISQKKPPTAPSSTLPRNLQAILHKKKPRGEGVELLLSNLKHQPHFCRV
jgi:hypothetical protein